MTNQAIAMIKSQMQEHSTNGTIQEIGKALIMLCETENCGELIAQDLNVPEMSLKHCYDKFYKYASKHKDGCCFGGSSELAEQLIREFYGIGKTQIAKPKMQEVSFSLTDFM